MVQKIWMPYHPAREFAPGGAFFCVFLGFQVQGQGRAGYREGLGDLVGVKAEFPTVHPAIRGYDVVDGLRERGKERIVLKAFGSDKFHEGGGEIHVTGNGVAGKHLFGEPRMLQGKGGQEPFPKGGLFSLHNAAGEGNDTDGVIPGDDEEAVGVFGPQFFYEVMEHLVRVPVAAKLAANGLVFPHHGGSLGHDAARIETVFLHGNVIGAMVGRGIDEMEGGGPIFFFFQDASDILQKNVIVDTQPGARASRRADLDAVVHFVKACCGRIMQEAPPGEAAAVPKGCAVAKTLQLQGKGCAGSALPELLILVEFHVHVVDTRKHAHDGGLGNHASGEHIVEGDSTGKLPEAACAVSDVQALVEGVQGALGVALREQKKDVPGHWNARPPGLAAEIKQGVIICENGFRQDGREDLPRFLVAVFEGGMDSMAAQDLEVYQVIQRGFCHEDVIFHNGGNLVPFRLVAMEKSAAITEPVIDGNGDRDEYGIERILKARGREFRPGKTGKGKKPFHGKKTKSPIGKVGEKNPAAVVLVEEDVGEVAFVRILSKPDSMVEDIMEVEIEDELCQEGRVDEEQVASHEPHAKHIADFVPEGKNGCGQGDQDEKRQERISIHVHAPPEAIAEAVIPLAPLAGRRFLRTVQEDEGETEDRTEKRRQQGEAQILLKPFEDERKHRKAPFGDE